MTGEAPLTQPSSAELNSRVTLPEETSVASTDDKEAAKVDIKSDSADEYVTGFRLALIVGSVALACFLMLLDTMVVSTVSQPCLIPLASQPLNSSQGNSAYYRHL